MKIVSSSARCMKRAADHSRIFGGKTLAGTFAIRACVSFILSVRVAKQWKKKKNSLKFYTDDSVEHWDRNSSLTLSSLFLADIVPKDN